MTGRVAPLMEAVRVSEGWCPLPEHGRLTPVQHGAAVSGECPACSLPDVSVQWFTDRDTLHLSAVGYGLHTGTCFSDGTDPRRIDPIGERVVRWHVTALVAQCLRRRS